MARVFGTMSLDKPFDDIPGKVDFRFRQIQACRTLLLVCAFVLAGGTMFGYALQVPFLYLPLADGGGTHPLTLLCAVLLAVALACDRPGYKGSMTQRDLPLIVLALGAMRYAEIAFAGGDLPFSDLLMPRGVRDGPDPIRMGGNTTIAVLLLATGLVAARRNPRIAFAIYAAMLFFPGFSLLGYIYRVRDLHGAMSPITAAIFLCLGLAAMAGMLRIRSLRVLLRDDLAGRLVRRQLAASTIFFSVLGFVMTRLDVLKTWHLQSVFAALAIWFVAGMILITAQIWETADIRRRRMERKLARLSVSDALTGLANRRAVEEVGRILFEQARRTRETLSALVIDVDHFKQVNDTYGHTVGDRLLKELAGVLEERLRSSDVVARWGGEEFLVLLPGAGEYAAEKVARELRRLIRDRLVLPGNGKRLTVSIGVAARAIDDTVLLDLVERADTALYAAKDKGRDRVISCRDIYREQSGDDCQLAEAACGRMSPEGGSGTPCGNCPLKQLRLPRLAGSGLRKRSAA